VGDRVAECLEDGPAAIKVGLLTTGHDEESVLGGRYASSAHRRVDHRDANLSRLLGERKTRLWIHRGVNGQRTAGRDASEYSLSAEDHVFDVGILDDADADDVAGGARVQTE
jgi:hypothetical protein